MKILDNLKIPLVKNTIDTEDIEKLIEWLKGNPRLTKGEMTIQLEKRWSTWLGTKYSVFVNSGSSANLAAIYAALLSGKLKNNKIVVPAVSWVTTISPAIQLGMEPFMCDCNMDNLGIDIEHLKEIIKKEDPGAIILVHVLGIANNLEEIKILCDDNNILLIEDTCEALGSRYDNQKLGTFGDMSTFSFYFGHHISTIEGGMISTDDEELYNILLSIRSHGWDRDLSPQRRAQLRSKYNVPNFRALYTFYYPGFNLRSTDLQAYIGLSQMNKVDMIVEKRSENFDLYNKLIKNKEWKINPDKRMFVSNFAYPIITQKIDKLVAELYLNNIETRPLICGSINKQPFWYERYGNKFLKNADSLHNNGLYLPNNHEITFDEITFISNIVNKVLNGEAR
ncbi:MAG: DegT/DnrJ/EryC1/StrS family aminotransferase [Promethearchaeota archaeon]